MRVPELIQLGIGLLLLASSMLVIPQARKEIKEGFKSS
jgi:hypothetical protein